MYAKYHSFTFAALQPFWLGNTVNQKETPRSIKTAKCLSKEAKYYLFGDIFLNIEVDEFIFTPN